MTLATFEQLLTASGQSALTAAADINASDETFLQAFEKLRKRFDPELAKAAIETVILRTKAKLKFPQVAKLFFEREALEQATHHLVAAHRAKRYAQFKTVLDLGCGLGADSIALANAGCRVVAVENDPLRARMAQANFAALGLPIPVLHVDALTTGLPPCDAIFCDPARRGGGRRHLKTDDYSPSPHEVIARFPTTPLSFKLAPGVAWNDLNRFGGEVEFVSLDRELKECRLWLGLFATGKRRATVLPADASLAGDVSSSLREIVEPEQFIYLPDAAVVRAGLEHMLAELLDARFLDAEQSILTSEKLTGTSFATAHQFDSIVTGSIGKLQTALRERGGGRVTFINIGSLREVESVRRDLKLQGDAHRVVILTRLAGAAAALIVQPAENQ